MILEHPSYLLYLLLLIPIALLLYYSFRKTEQSKSILLDSKLRDEHADIKGKRKNILAGALIMISILFFITALANPLGPPEKIEVERRSTDVMYALDISRSMLAEDIKPSRLQRAKILASEMIKEMEMERLGLIVFAADAYVSMPLSIDHAAALLYLKAANPLSTSNQGTSVGAAIRTYIEAIEEEESRQRVMIIISDGEDHDNDAIEAAELARSKGITIYTIGVGTAEGAQITVRQNNRSFILKQNNGLPVVTKYNPEFLKKVASAGGGVYYDILAGRKIITDLTSRIQAMDKELIAEETIDTRTTYFYFPLLGGIIFLFGFVIVDRDLLQKF